MSANLQIFRLKDLTVLRFCCDNCKCTVEAPFDRAKTAFNEACCPLCKKLFGLKDNPVFGLVNAIEILRQLNWFNVEFVTDAD